MESRVLHGVQRTMVMVAIMAAMFMQLLDTTIANVALPHMQTALGANQESINWVLTSYIVMSAIAIPITGWLADRIGRRQLLLISTVAFTAASVLCAIATSLPEMVAFRIIQGITGAFIPPLVQATLYDIHPPEAFGRAMSIFGTGVVLAPIMGPVVGGWLTENLSWRWVFLINLPIGVIATLLMLRYMPRIPKVRESFDISGFLLLGLALASFQLMLDRGHTVDWFDSIEIVIELGIAIGAMWMFIIHSINTPQPLFERSMITDRSYVAGLLLMFLSGAVLVAGMALTPPLLQQIYNYGVLESGYLTGVRGIAAMFAMIASGRLVDKFDVRWLLLFGVLGIAASLYVLSLASLEMGPGLIIWSSLLQGAGVGFVFIPIQAVAFASVPPNLRTKASSMFNLSRNFGGSVAVAIVGSLLARGAQVSHADLSQYVNPQNMPIADPGLIGVLGDAGQSVMVMIEAEIMRQSLFLSYLGDFRLMMWASLAMLPLILLADFGKGGKKQEERTEHPVHLD